MPTSRSRARRAFTILELLIAMSITVILAGLLVSLTDGILNIWGRTTGSLTLVNQSKLILDQVATDLQNLVLRANHPGVFLAVTVQSDQAGTGDAGVSDASWSASAGGAFKPPAADGSYRAEEFTRPEELRFGRAGVWLRLFATEADSNRIPTGGFPNDITGVRAIGYQIVRHPVDSSASSDLRWLLYRTSARVGALSARTASATESTLGLGLDILSPAFSDTDIGGTNPDDPGLIRRPTRNYTLGNHVIDFGVRIYDRNESGELRQRFPYDTSTGQQVWAFLATSAVSRTPINPSAPPPGVPNNIAYGVPAVIEVIVRIATDEGARRIQNLERGRVGAPAGFTPGEYWWQVADESSQVFVRRVEIPTRPL